MSRLLPRISAATAVCGLVAAAPTSAAAPQSPPPAGPALHAKAWTLIDATTGQRLAGRDDARPLPVASATKLMTARLALSRLPLGRRLRAPAYNALPAESTVGLRRGEQMTVRDLLYALILPSANDAAATLAKGVAGSIPAFVDEMNREARRLHLASSTYRNPVGLDEPGHLSSAADLAHITRLLLRDPTFARIADTPRTVLRSGGRVRRITTRNDLLLRYPPLTGVKTGHTLKAGYVLVGSVRSRGERLISVVLGTTSESARDAESLRLLRYGLRRFRHAEPLRRGQVVTRAGVRFEDGKLPLVAARAVSYSVRRGVRVRRSVTAPDEVEGPVRRGQRLGRVRYLAEGGVLAESPLAAGRAVAEPGIFDRLRSALPVSPAVALMLLGVIVMLSVVVSRERSRARRRRRRAEARARTAR